VAGAFHRFYRGPAKASKEAFPLHRIIDTMARIDMHLKVVVELDEEERPERLAAEICRSIRKIYGVRSAELTNWVKEPE
jgi:hypothetical protein